MKKLMVIMALCMMMVGCNSDDHEMVCTYKKDKDKGTITVRYSDDKIKQLQFDATQYIDSDLLDEVGEKDFEAYWRKNVEAYNKEGVSVDSAYDKETRMASMQIDVSLDQLKDRNYSDFYLNDNLSLKSFKKRVEDQLNYTCK